MVSGHEALKPMKTHWLVLGGSIKGYQFSDRGSSRSFVEIEELQKQLIDERHLTAQARSEAQFCTDFTAGRAGKGLPSRRGSG